jgi:nucleotide-binding universal stress UspA family protein
MFKKILVPLDGSALAEAALPVARVLAKHNGATLLLVHVHEPMPWLGMDRPPSNWADLMQQAEAAARGHLHQHVQTCNSIGLPTQAAWVAHGPADTGIVDTAKNHSADVIVMATHGRSAVARMLLGSVADRVLHTAACPVMLIRPDLSAYRA